MVKNAEGQILSLFGIKKVGKVVKKVVKKTEKVGKKLEKLLSHTVHYYHIRLCYGNHVTSRKLTRFFSFCNLTK